MANIEKMIEEIDKLTVVELSELVKAIEEKYDVSAAAVAAPVAGGAVAAEGGAEEKSEYDIELKESGPNKIPVIKIVREVTGLGLGEAKALVDGAPKVIKEGVAKEEAEEIVAKIKEAGGVAELK